MPNDDTATPLIDPDLLATIPESEREEALAAAAAARRAEERAEQRALQRALEKKQALRQQHVPPDPTTTNTASTSNQSGVVFVSKRKRGLGAVEPSLTTASTAPLVATTSSTSVNKTSTGTIAAQSAISSTSQSSSALSAFTDAQRTAIQRSYLGKGVVESEEWQLEQQKKRRAAKKITFKFKWDNADDTLDSGDDVLYQSMLAKRQPKKSKLDTMPNVTLSLDTVMKKSLSQMTVRDWRIVRENFDIVVKGGKTPPPMRSFRESALDSRLLDAIERTLRYKDPSPIQRQAIPIGLQRRDLIGLAETGSGKTAAFGVPLCHYVLSLPNDIVRSVADQGPLALVMAPTRELALQIDVEFQKLLSFAPHIFCAGIVGGQPLAAQAQRLREGVHIVVGTPGRLNECLDMAYMVLNQCCYVVLDEADRMVDMGFAPQISSILDAMGGALKSVVETEAYEQELQDLSSTGLPVYRLTAMFSATMPSEVERMAKTYLRHPAVLSIGDADSRKNARIQQRLVFLPSPKHKERALRDLLGHQAQAHDKIIVFVNEKKHADGVGRMVERLGRKCVVLHGGKSQEAREENLALFRNGGGVVLVATDVAGRGLDIPNVSHVINFDLPTRSIDNYSHRIGRTGRAGKEGLATSFITDEDEGIMSALKQYLESTGNDVPDRLARHPAASAGSHGSNIT
jgi:ATP-dependent RNA helicase DDX23/PRP28